MTGLAISGKGIKVLYAEDDRLARELLSTMIPIRFPGIEVFCAENGTQGLKFYIEHQPDIILTDIRMPELNGVNMAEKIKQLNPEATIIIISGHSETTHLLRAIELGINRYILKPFDTEKVFETLADVIVGLNMKNQLKEQQKQLHETRERLNAVIESNDDAVFIKDRQGRYVMVNNAAALMINKSMDQIIGFDDMALFPPETAICSQRNDQMVINSGNIMRFEETIVDRHGDVAFYLVTKGPLHDDQGEVTATFGISHNITERKRYEAQIEKQNLDLEQRVRERTRELEQSNREMESFCHAISHELRAPIARLEGFQKAVVECLSSEDYSDITYFMERLDASTEQLKAAVDALIMMNRLTKSDIAPEPVNLTILSQQVMINLMEEYGNLNIHFNNRPGTIVEGDRKLLTLCLHNLLGNALKYSSKKSESLINFGMQEQAGQKVYFVRDNGAGFDMAYVNNLFKPFSRLHHASEFEGTGIGLATVHRIIEKHNGKIWAESQLNEGTTIFFTLADSTGMGTPPKVKGGAVPAIF